MLENQGDGTFIDVAKEIGLQVEYLVNCTLFLDTDNDGDQDLIMGRWSRQSISATMEASTSMSPTRIPTLEPIDSILPAASRHQMSIATDCLTSI